MAMFMIPAGEYLQLRNLTEKNIKNLNYTYGTYPSVKIKKIDAHTKENFMIITTNLPKDYDLEFFFRKISTERSFSLA